MAGARTQKALEKTDSLRMIHLCEPHTLMGHQFFREALDSKVRAQFLIVALPRWKKRSKIHTQSRVSLSATIIIVIPSVAGTACWLRELPLGFAFLIPRLQKEATTTAQALPRTMPASFVTLRAQIFDSRPRPNFHAKNADCSFLCETLSLSFCAN